MTPEDFGRLFSTFTRSAFRLETLSRYTVPDEAERFEMFLSGAPSPGPDASLRAWQEMVRTHTAAGRQMQRVHLIRGPLTDYLRFEIDWGYRDNVEAGEDIRILHVGPDALPELGTEDFWLFDDRIVVCMRYDNEGRWIGADRADPELLSEYQRRRDRTLALAVSLSDYLAEVPSL